MTHFSPREQEILHSLAQFRSYAEMAVLFGIRVSTVRAHAESISMKTDVHTQIKLVGYAIEHGYSSRFQVALQEVQQVPRDSRLLTGKDVYKAFMDVYPDLVLNWHQLTRPSKTIYEKVAHELNCILCKMSRD